MRFSTLANRTGHLLAVMLLVTIATFGMLELLPGNLAYSILGEGAKPDDIARVEKELGLDRPIYERFAGWLGNAVTGDLGKSYATGQRVSEAIAQRLPVSLQLMIMAQVLALVLALPLGLWAGYREGGTVDRLISSGAFGILAVPHFVLGIVLILLLAVWLRWLPASGFVAFGTDPVGNIRAMILPSLTLALVEAPVYLRLLRSDIASTLREEFILVARAKGLSDWRILLTHALRPSSFSLVTVMGINIGHLIGGTVIIETLFALPGVGRLLIEAINTRDLLMVQGGVLFIAAAFVLVNAVVDTIYAVLDPRLRHGR
jgi:peptide/nickel transport system permease protein